MKYSLDIFSQKRLYEELLGYLINNEKLNVKKKIKNIKNKKYKIIFSILLQIPFSKFFTKLTVYLYKNLFLR